MTVSREGSGRAGLLRALVRSSGGDDEGGEEGLQGSSMNSPASAVKSISPIHMDVGGSRGSGSLREFSAPPTTTLIDTGLLVAQFDRVMRAADSTAAPSTRRPSSSAQRRPKSAAAGRPRSPGLGYALDVEEQSRRREAANALAVLQRHAQLRLTAAVRGRYGPYTAGDIMAAASFLRALRPRHGAMYLE